MNLEDFDDLMREDGGGPYKEREERTLFSNLVRERRWENEIF
jgi:hypothetical protein